MTDESKEEQIQPDRFEASARHAVEQIAELWGTGQYTPPFEIIFTDADGHLVMGIIMDQDGIFKSLARHGGIALPMRRRWPSTNASRWRRR